MKTSKTSYVNLPFLHLLEVLLPLVLPLAVLRPDLFVADLLCQSGELDVPGSVVVGAGDQGLRQGHGLFEELLAVEGVLQDVPVDFGAAEEGHAEDLDILALRQYLGLLVLVVRAPHQVQVDELVLLERPLEHAVADVHGLKRLPERHEGVPLAVEDVDGVVVLLGEGVPLGLLLEAALLPQAVQPLLEVLVGDVL